jgi:hypothetical protein
MFGIKATPDYIGATVHPHAAGVADLICAQGPAYARAFPYPAPVRVTGNPRSLTYAKRTSPGEDILVCLQSGNINNHGRTFEAMVGTSLELGPSLRSPQGLAWAGILRSSIAQECDILPLVKDTIAALAAAFPDRRIAVRPHPVEDPAAWTFAQQNVVLSAEGSISESLQNARVAVFVSGCTTGLDAYLAGVPAVRLGAGGHGISGDMHVEARSAADAVEAVRKAETWQGSITDHLAAPDVISPLAELYRAHATGGGLRISVPTGFEPSEFRRRKFPDTSDDEMQGLLGRPIQRIGWNTFLAAAG